jgi:hypothetical protein
LIAKAAAANGIKARVKARSHGLLIAIPYRARLIPSGRREAHDFARNTSVPNQTEPLDGREIIEVDLGMRWIGGDRD